MRLSKLIFVDAFNISLISLDNLIILIKKIIMAGDGMISQKMLKEPVILYKIINHHISLNFCEILT